MRIHWLKSSAPCLHRNCLKNALQNTHPAILQINKDLTKACSSLIIDVLAKLTRQARNPGYNLWDKYFIANICLCILCQCVLKLLQMNVKREVSEQAVKGTEQRCSSAVRRKEDSQEERTQQQTIFLGLSNKLNMQYMQYCAKKNKNNTKIL